MQLKEQLTVAAVVAGVAEFECDVICFYFDELLEALGRVRVDVAGREARREERERERREEERRARGRQEGWEGVVDQGAEGIKRSRTEKGGVYGVESRGRPVVDVLAVTCTFSLQDYPDDSLLRSNPRDTVLKVRGAQRCVDWTLGHLVLGDRRWWHRRLIQPAGQLHI